MIHSPRTVKKSTKNTKFNELVKMVNEAEDKKHPSTVSAKHAIEKVNNMRDNGQIIATSASFQHSDGESDEKIEKIASYGTNSCQKHRIEIEQCSSV